MPVGAGAPFGFNDRPAAQMLDIALSLTDFVSTRTGQLSRGRQQRDALFRGKISQLLAVLSQTFEQVNASGNIFSGILLPCHFFGGIHFSSRISRSTRTPSIGFVETPALARSSEFTARNLNFLTIAPTTRPTSNWPKNFPGHTRAPCPKPKCKKPLADCPRPARMPQPPGAKPLEILWP